MKTRLAMHGNRVLLAALSVAQDAGPPERRGAAPLSQHCGMCHAVGREDASAEPQAPALRTIARRVPVDRLEAQLSTGGAAAMVALEELRKWLVRRRLAHFGKGPHRAWPSFPAHRTFDRQGIRI